jgi:hypothetical protein
MSVKKYASLRESGGLRVTPPGAQGIEAEILFCGKAAKKIAAQSPVFGTLASVPKMRPTSE